MSVTIISGDLKQSAALSNPGAAVPDGDGGFTYVYTAIDPSPWRCAIEKATVANSEKLFAGTVLSHAMYIMSGRYHPLITTKTRVVWTDHGGDVHTANVLDVSDTEGGGVETVILISEIAQ